MTTLAYRDGVLAADSRATCSDWIVAAPSVKVHKRADGTLIGTTGCLASTRRFAEWLESDQKADKPKLEEARVVVVSPDGAIRVHEGDGSYVVDPAPFHAWGSGMPCALSAMHAGASAEEAVRIACLIDSLSGGGIRTVRLDNWTPKDERLPVHRRYGFNDASYYE